MKQKIFLLVFFFLELQAASLLAKENPLLEPPLKQLTAGEELIFDVVWMGIPVGMGVLKVEKGEDAAGHETYHVTAIAETNEFLSKIYPVHDEIHSVIDAGRWRSLEFRKNLKEGRYRADEKVVYDYPNKKGFYESGLNKSRKEFDVPSDAQDFLSAFFWFRTQDVQVGKSARTVINDEGKNWDLEAKVLGFERKELKGRRIIQTVVVEPKTSYNGVLYNRGRAWVYFSTAPERVPVWIKIHTPLGPVVGVLRAASGNT